MSPELQYIRVAVERITRDCPESTWRHSPPGKWCCAEIVEHLMLSYTGTTRGLLNAMRSGRPLASRQVWPDRVRTFAVIKLGYFPSGRTAPRYMTPKDGLDVISLRGFYDALVAMDATLADAERRFGERVKLLDHHVLGPLDAHEWRRFHQVHSKHHLKQMKTLSRAVEFLPAGRQLSN